MSSRFIGVSNIGAALMTCTDLNEGNGSATAYLLLLEVGTPVHPRDRPLSKVILKG